MKIDCSLHEIFVHVSSTILIERRITSGKFEYAELVSNTLKVAGNVLTSKKITRDEHLGRNKVTIVLSFIF